MSKLQPLRGMKDLLPEDFKNFEYIVNKAKDITELYGYLPISTPILEYTSVFNRTLGELSDVVSKEIYEFTDKSNESVALRPEFTAGIMRSFIYNTKLWHKTPLRYFSYGPIFRYDRPQAGRQRQFHQFNCEYLGAKGAYADVEVIKLANHILRELDLTYDVVLEINSLGCFDSKANYEKALYDYFLSHQDELSEDSKRRLHKNPLRILDSKELCDQRLLCGAPVIQQYYTLEAKKYFDDVLKYLDLLGIQYTINNTLVRGLDYYCHTIFEFINKNFATQSAVLAGGRYDGLCKLMGGSDLPAIGFAAGIERIMLIKDYKILNTPPVYILPIDENSLEQSILLINKLHENNIKAVLDINGKVTKRIQKLIEQDINYMIFVGDEEVSNNTYTIKHIQTKTEEKLSLHQLINKLTK